ncbi:MAG: response regulator [Pseudomonadota bacterium]
MKTRILVADDEKIVVRDLTECLRYLQLELVGLAGTSEEAVRKAEAIGPDLVLIDIALPGWVKGRSAASYIRDSLNIPVVCLASTSDFARQGPDALQEGHLILTKPFTIRRLRHCIGTALARKIRFGMEPDVTTAVLGTA